jgi:hypothetical protein
MKLLCTYYAIKKVIVIELWCCGLVALIQGIIRRRLPLKASRVKKVGWYVVSFGRPQRGRKVKRVNAGIRAN